MASILIPDYFGKQVIAGCKALSIDGDKCDFAWKTGGKISRFIISRYVNEFFPITSASVDADKYVDDVERLCEANNYDLILPFGNSTYYALVMNQHRLSGVTRLMVPDIESYKIAYDKARTADFCGEIGIDSPKTFRNFSEDDLSSIANELVYPVVIKARSGSGVEKGIRYANSREELFTKYHEITAHTSPAESSSYENPIIQEFIPGFIHDACTLTNRGRVVNVLTQVRRVMRPIYGGPGAINFTTHNKEIDALARRLLEALNWHGPAQIEFKYDPRDKKYKLIEINPKFWGTLALSIKVGVNFPKMVRDILLGEKVEHDQSYPANVRYVFLFPGAAIGILQLIKEFGINSAIDKKHYAKTYYDFDFYDLGPYILRIVRTLREIREGKINAVNSNLDLQLVNQLGNPEIEKDYD